MLRALHYSHHLLDALIQKFPTGVFLDGTLGKGNDSYYILNHPHFKGVLYSFDIQAFALEASRKKIDTLSPERQSAINLIHDSHHHLESHIPHKNLHGAIYNLGYLPGGDHSITTLPETTLSSLHQVAKKLDVGGQIILVIYSGHPEGKVEKDALFDELSTWPQEEFQVLHYGFINQRNHPPQLLIVERVGLAKD